LCAKSPTYTTLNGYGINRHQFGFSEAVRELTRLLTVLLGRWSDNLYRRIGGLGVVENATIAVTVG
jgi:hypothetical protein